VILVGDDPASAVYVRNKVKACQDHGLRSVMEKYDATLPSRPAGAHRRAQCRPRIHGILVQMPLPKHIDPQRSSPPSPREGRRRLFGALGRRADDRPAGPAAGHALRLHEADREHRRRLKGKHAVVIGRSNTVGKPMALLLLQANATVTVCHSATPDIAVHTRQADMVVAATGPAQHAHGRHGQARRHRHRRRHEPQRSRQAVRRRRLRRRARGLGDGGWITPVPGGVGPMTITMLLVNTLQAAEAAA
jgi:methylenetetrahydrofolate dehydrogenase (NADP+)/methenyltetrahydrofolate cyclohydrolase